MGGEEIQKTEGLRRAGRLRRSDADEAINKPRRLEITPARREAAVVSTAGLRGADQFSGCLKSNLGAREFGGVRPHRYRVPEDEHRFFRSPRRGHAYPIGSPADLVEQRAPRPGSR